MSISQEARYRLNAISYSMRRGVPRACANYQVSAASIYRWRKLYQEGGLAALEKRSRRPKHHPSEHTPSEIKLIKDMRRRNPNIGLQDLWLRLRVRGYTRSMQGLAKVLKRLKMPTDPKTRPSPTCRRNRPYEQMSHPGERIQIDVKFVPKECLAPEFIEKYQTDKLYQYTAIDEYSRYRILGGYLEHNTYSSAQFAAQVISAFKALGIGVECIQTDNGAEFTKSFFAGSENNRTIFEKVAIRSGVKLKRIKPHTPRHNGKVERSHREDQKTFYSEMVRLNRPITDIKSFRSRLKRHQDKSNNRPMRPLGYMSPKQYLSDYLNKHKGK